MQLQEEKLPSYDRYSVTQCPAAEQKQSMYHLIDLRKEVLPLKGGGGQRSEDKFSLGKSC